MSLFAKLKEYRDSRRLSKVERAAKLAKTQKAIKEDRWGAIEFLCDLEDADQSCLNLLPRFEFSLEHGINDTREKELAMKGIVAHGKAALPHVRNWIRTTTKIAWPIKMLKALATPEEVVEALKEALNFDDVSFDQGAVDKNFDILCYLREYQLGSMAERLAHFLKDADERVRFACVEVLVEQDDKGIAPLLEPFLTDATSENSRLRQSVVRAFVDKGWKVTDPNVFVNGVIQNGVKVKSDGTVVAS